MSCHNLENKWHCSFSNINWNVNSWLFTKCSWGVEVKVTKSKFSEEQGRGLEPRNTRLQVQCLDHLATLPPQTCIFNTNTNLSPLPAMSSWESCISLRSCFSSTICFACSSAPISCVTQQYKRLSKLSWIFFCWRAIFELTNSKLACSRHSVSRPFVLPPLPLNLTSTPGYKHLLFNSNKIKLKEIIISIVDCQLVTTKF